MDHLFRLDPLRASIDAHPRRAAVAVVLRGTNEGPEVLLMKRAEHPGDRWSGHVSFPGGREEPDDPTMFDTAVRETREEVGIDLLATSRPLGRLQTTDTRPRTPIRPLVIIPFVFELAGPVTLQPNAEVQECFWLPLEPAFRGEFDGVHPYQLGPVRMKLPCWHHAGKTIWGLTYKMLLDLQARQT